MELIPCVQEEQSGSGSANYDVELIHLSEAHRDILRGGRWTLCLTSALCGVDTVWGGHCMGVDTAWAWTLHGCGVYRDVGQALRPAELIMTCTCTHVHNYK